MAAVGFGGDDGGGHGGEGSFARGDGVGGTLDEAVGVGDALFRGEVVHLVVHEEAERGDGDARAEGAVEGVGVGDGVAPLVDDGEMGGFGGRVGVRLEGGGRWEEAGGTFELGRGRGVAGVDRGAPGCGIGGVGELPCGDGGEVGVAEVAGAVHVGAAKGFGDGLNLGSGAIGTELRQIVTGEDI